MLHLSGAGRPAISNIFNSFSAAATVVGVEHTIVYGLRKFFTPFMLTDIVKVEHEKDDNDENVLPSL